MHEAAYGGLLLRICSSDTSIGQMKASYSNYSPFRPKTPVLAGNVMIQKQQARLVHADSLNIRYKVPLVPAQRACLQSILIQHGGEQGKRDR